MKEQDVCFYICPECGCEKIDTLEFKEYRSIKLRGEIKEGSLQCNSCKKVFPIINYIPRFVHSNNYSSSFGYQWNKHSKTQIDKYNGTDISRKRFFRVTNWPKKMEGQRILEVGCGAGRFTQIAIETSADVFSFDYSNAVDANLGNNGLHRNLHLFQGDIYCLPFKKESFDKIFCLGVLQHCPNPQKAFFSLVQYLKSGGEIVIDVYNKSLKSILDTKYILRFFTKRLTQTYLYIIICGSVPILLPMKVWAREKLPLVGKYIGAIIPVIDYKGILTLNKDQLLEWAILDTFDKLSPRYDKPQTIEEIRKWFYECSLNNVKVNYGPNGINGKGKKS